MSIDSCDETITTRERLRELTRRPSERALNKVIDHIDAVCRRFIAASPFVMVASRGADGRIDLSPKGDPPGFVEVLDGKTLAIPDRPGNHRHDTFENVLACPNVGLCFFIPGHGDTLRISGKATIVRDGRLQARLAVGGKAPNLILLVTVERAFMHCSKCVTRSRLWNPEQWPDRSHVPTLAEAIIAHAKPAQTLSEVKAFIDAHNADLY
jgi:PPOX class probable FMN-dependent enzyme